MKLKRLCIILTLLLVWNGTLLPTVHAADPPVIPSVAPARVPDSLSATEWETIQEQVRQAEYYLRLARTQRGLRGPQPRPGLAHGAGDRWLVHTPQR